MTSDRYINARLADYEDIIRQIRDVISARIVNNDSGEISEIHVLAGSGRNPKQIVRDIESAFMAQFGVSIDHKKISVAQMQDEEGYRSVIEVRPKVSSVTLLTGGRSTDAKVLLALNDEVIEGCASGPSTANNKLRLISQATLLALENYLKGNCNLVTEDISLITLAKQQAVSVSVSLVTNIGEERLIGAAFINNDERVAVVKATLAAVNRRMALLLSE